MSEYRPSFFVPAAWIMVETPNGTVEYFKLDEDGNLILSNGELVPHHVNCLSRADDSSVNQTVSGEIAI